MNRSGSAPTAKTLFAAILPGICIVFSAIILRLSDPLLAPLIESLFSLVLVALSLSIALWHPWLVAIRWPFRIVLALFWLLATVPISILTVCAVFNDCL